MADTGIRINEIPRDNELNDGDLLHVYKEINGVFRSVSAPVQSIAFRGPKGEDGQPGQDGYSGGTIAQLVVYRRIDPTTIAEGTVNELKPGYGQNDDGSYDFTNKIFTPPQNPRWYKNVPPVEAGKEDWVLYSASGVAQVLGSTGIDNNIEWSDPEPNGIQGLPGSAGKSTYQAVIFTRSSTVPPAPTGGTFNFGTDELTPPAGWFRDVGGDLGPKLGGGASDAEEAAYQGQQLWMCNHQFSIVGDEGIDTAGTWSLPTRFASDGADGFSTYFGSIYKRTNEVGLVSFTDNISEGLNYMPRPGEGDPALGGRYDFRLNKFILPDGPGEQFEGWSEEVPDDFKVAGRTTDLWVSHTVASARSNFTGNEDVIDDSLVWSWPKKVSQATIDGNQGNVVAQVRAYLRSVGDAPHVTSLSAAEFNFQDKILNLQGTGWSSEPYKSTLEDNNIDYGRDFLYVAVGIAESVYDPESGQYPNDTDIQWGDPILAPEDGEVAVSTYLAQVYTRYSGSEDIQVESYIPTGGSYNFGQNSLGLPSDPNGELTWSSTIPPGPGQIYVSQRNFNVRGNTGTDYADSDNPWSIPAILAYDGVAGFDGVTNTRITLYYGSDTQLTGNNIPTMPSEVNIAVDLARDSSNFGNVIRTEINGQVINVTSDHKILTKNSNGDDVDTGWRTELPDNDWVYSIQALASDSDETDDNYIDIIASNEWSDTVSFRKPGGQGLTGLATTVVSLYKRTSSPNTPSPEKPTGSFRYYLGDEGSNKRGELIEIESANKQGWSLTAPSYNGSNHYLWQINATASSRDNYDIIPDTEWTSPIIFSQNPFDLTETTVSHIVQAYIRSSVLPTTNPGTCTVALSGETAGQITNVLSNGWSDTIPDGDQQVYIVHATASGNVSNINDTDTIEANEWSAPAKWGIVGERGLRGESGGIGRPLTLFKRTDFTPIAGELDLPTLSGTYDFVSDTWTFGTYLSNGDEGTTNGWTYELPSKDTTDRVLWQTFATAISTQDSSSDIILSDDWSSPRATSQDGAVTPIYSTVENPTTVAQCSLTQTNSDFVFVSFYNSSITNISSLTDNVIEDLVFIKMLGRDGTSINIKDSLDSVDDLPTSNNIQGDSYLISGSLYVYNGTEFVDAGSIQGPAGIRGADGADGISSYLHIAYADDEFGTNFTTDNNPGDRSFLGTYTDSNELDSTNHDDYTWVKIVGKDGSAGRPNGCEAVYGYGNSQGPSSITYLEDENVLQLQGVTDTSIGMVYPAVDVSDGRKVRFTVTYKSPDVTVPTLNGLYIRLYSITKDLAEGKDRVGYRYLGDTQNSPLIQDYDHQYTRSGADTLYIKVTPSASLENAPVPGEYTTRTIEFTPAADDRYVSLTILNWTGLGIKRLWVKPVTTTVIGEKGDSGAHGLTSRIIEIFRSASLTQQAPASPTGTASYDIATGSLSNVPTGWLGAAPNATSGTKIYRSTALVTYSADRTSGTVNVTNWSEVRAWSVGAGRTAPVVSRLANYKYFDSNYSTSDNSQSPTNAYYSFRKSGSINSEVNSGWSASVKESTDPITDIKQILFNRRGTDNVDYTDFWKGFDTASELLWKYGSSWIIFKRTEQVDIAGDWTGVRVEVIDHSDDINQIKDLPGFHTTQDDPLEADVVFGYTPTIIRETVFLHKRSGATAPAKPTSNLIYNFNTSSFAGSLDGWTIEAPSSSAGGKYLWRIQATANAALNISDGVYKDDISSSEWSAPRILAQDGIDGNAGNTYFQKFLYTRTSTSAPNLKTNWVAENKPKQLQVTVDGTGVSESIGDVRSTSISNLTSTYGVVWSESIPNESNGQFLWVIVAPVTSTNTSGNYVTINNTQWAAPVLLTKDGVGLNSVTVRLYKRTTGNAPTGGVANNHLGFKVNGNTNPSTKPTFTYNFSNGNLDNKTVDMNGWSQNIPETGGSTLWVSRAVASSTGTTDEIPWIEWQAPEKLVTDGTSLIFIESFATRNDYLNHINTYYNGKPPYNSYHIETVSGRNVSYLYIGGQNTTDKNSSSNFRQLTIDGANGQNGQNGLSFEFKGTVNSITDVSNLNLREGDVYRVTGSDNSVQGDPRDNSAPAILVYKNTGWALLTTDGAPGADSTVQGPNGNSVFITYSSKPITSIPTKPDNTSNGNVSGVWTTTPINGTRYNWMSQKIAQTNTSGTWGAPIRISGEDGETGFRTLEIAVYQRSETKPGTPPSTGNSRGAYDFWYKRLLPPAGWSSTIKNAGADRESATFPSDPKNSYGYEYKYSTSINWNASNTWQVERVDNSSKANLPLWKTEATVSVVANNTNVNQIDSTITWSTPVLQELNGVDLIDNSVDVDRVYQAVKNGGGVEKIVATDRQDPPQLLTQAAYDALANTNDPNRNQYGWTYNATEGYDTVHDDTLYIIF